MNIIQAIFRSIFIYTMFVFLVGCVLTFTFTIGYIKQNFNVIDGKFIRIEQPDNTLKTTKAKDQKWETKYNQKQII